jgi:hypothetical protein
MNFNIIEHIFILKIFTEMDRFMVISFSQTKFDIFSMRSFVTIQSFSYTYLKEWIQIP